MAQTTDIDADGYYGMSEKISSDELDLRFLDDDEGKQ